MNRLLTLQTWMGNRLSNRSVRSRRDSTQPKIKTAPPEKPPTDGEYHEAKEAPQIVPESPDRLKQIADRAGSTRALCADMLLIGVIVLIAFVVGSALVTPWLKTHHLFGMKTLDDYHRPIQIGAFNVPKSLQDQGYTPEYLAALMRDKIIYVDLVSDRSDTDAFSKGTRKGLPPIEVPGGKIDVGEMQKYLVEKYDPSPHLDGTVTTDGHTLTVSLLYNAEQDGGHAENSSIPLPEQTHTYTVTSALSKTNPARSFESAMLAAALKFEGYYRPYTAASYYYNVTAGRKKAGASQALTLAYQEGGFCFQNAPRDDHAPARELQGLILLDRNQPDGAAQMFSEAIHEDPTYLSPHFYLGITDIRQLKFNDAIAEFRKLPPPARKLTAARRHDVTNIMLRHRVRDLEPGRINQYWAYALYGRAKTETGLTQQADLTAAIDKYVLALATLPGDQEIQLRYAVTLTDAGRYTEAEAQYRAMIKQYPKRATPYAYLGACLEMEVKLLEKKKPLTSAEVRRHNILSAESYQRYRQAKLLDLASSLRNHGTTAYDAGRKKALLAAAIGQEEKAASVELLITRDTIAPPGSPSKQETSYRRPAPN